MRSRRFLLAWLAVAVCASGSLAAQALYLGGVAITLGDRQSTTIANLSARFSVEPLDSINYMVYERSPERRSIGSVSFKAGVVTIASREWYSGRDDERAFGTAFMGAVQALGIQSQAIPVTASYQTNQDPSGWVRTAKFVNGLRSVTVYYSEGPGRAYAVQITETISRFGI